jgi:hypothetical protein
MQPHSETSPLRASRILIALGVWLSVATVIGTLGLLGRLRPPGPQLVILALTLTLLGTVRFAPALRAWVAQTDWRTLVGVHVIRVVAGTNFLVLVSRGALDSAFVQAGVGDLVVGLLALGLIVFVPPARRGARSMYLAWNVLGVTDILLVLMTAVRVGMRNPELTAGFGYLPLAWLPLFVVPIIIASHVLLFGRLLDGHASRVTALRESTARIGG